MLVYGSSRFGFRSCEFGLGLIQVCVISIYLGMARHSSDINVGSGRAGYGLGQFKFGS